LITAQFLQDNDQHRLELMMAMFSSQWNFTTRGPAAGSDSDRPQQSPGGGAITRSATAASSPASVETLTSSDKSYSLSPPSSTSLEDHWKAILEFDLLLLGLYQAHTSMHVTYYLKKYYAAIYEVILSAALCEHVSDMYIRELK
jgi:hypothetical protein